MMGLPSLGLPTDESQPEEDAPGKQTMFGFPSQKTEQFSLNRMNPEADASDPVDGGPDVEDDFDEEEGGGATTIMAFSSLDFGEDSALRGTMAGTPAQQRPAPRKQAPQEEESDASDEVVSGSAVFAASAKPSNDSRLHGGTLMGMTVEEIQAQMEDALDDDSEAAVRGTAFGVPALQGLKKSATDAASDASEAVEDSPTQAWNPGKEAKLALSAPDSRKKLLEKIRKSKPPRETSKGIPAASRTTSSAGKDSAPGDGIDLSALRKLKPSRELSATPAKFLSGAGEDADNAAAPAQGVVKPPARTTGPTTPADKGPATPAGAYMFGRGETPEPSKPPASKGVPIAQMRPARPSFEEMETEKDLGDDLSDVEFAFAETGVASPAELAKARRSLEKQQAKAAPVFDEGDDSTVPMDQEAVLAFVNDHHAKQQAEAARQTMPTPRKQSVVSPDSIPDFEAPQSPAPAAQPAQPSTPHLPTAEMDPPRERVPSFAPQGSNPGISPQFNGQRQPQHTPAPFAPAAPMTAPNHGVPANTAGGQAEDPTVRLIQSVFGGLAGLITFVVVLFVLLEGLPASTGGIILVAFAVMLGAASFAAAFAPLPSKVRSTALVAVGALLLLCALTFFTGSVPKMFLVLGLGGFVAFMAAAFPSIARKLM